MKVGDRVRVRCSPTLKGTHVRMPEHGVPGEVGVVVEVDAIGCALVDGVGRAGRHRFWHRLVDLEPAPENRWMYDPTEEVVVDTDGNIVGRHQPATGRLAAAAPAMRALLERLVAIEGPQPGTASWAGEVRDLLATLVDD